MARGRSGSRGLKDWGGVNFGSTTVSLTQAQMGTSLLDVEPVTLLRIRGNLLVKGTPNAVADDDVVGLGFIVATDNAVAAGGASLPGPILNPDAPWIWHQYVPLSAGSAGLLGDDIGSVVRVDVDSKAMRKLGISEQLVLVAEISTDEYASVTLNGGFRVLALHS